MRKKINISDVNDYLRFLSGENDFSDQILNQSRSMISIINRNYVYEKVNTTFCIAHQIDNESIVGKSLGEVWGNDTFQNVIRSNIDLCFSGETISYEALFETPQFGKRYFEVIFRPISVENGEITYLLAETLDVNDLIESKQTAIEKEEELRRFEINLPIGFLRCNPDGNILHTNKTFLRILECHDQVLVQNFNIKSFYQDEDCFETQIEQLLACNPKNFGRISLKNCKGYEIPCRISGFMVFDESKKPLFIDFAVEDSTRELILENRLLQAQKLETIGSLAGGIAHDFNNILTTISGYSEMLKEDLPKDSVLSEKVSKIQTAILKAQSITNQMLTFSRQVEQEKIPTGASKVLKETIGFIKSSLPPNIIIKSHIPKKDANILVDPTQLFRVFLNLMTNAIHSMEENGGTLYVNLVLVEGKQVQHELNKVIVADEYVLITFRDTGKGMDASLVKRIFEPFFTTREVGKGTGLGLSVIHGIISEIEGDILVSSKKEKGSVFYVYLPVSKEYPDISVKVKNRKKILFITGNKYESRILSIALENSGYDLIYISDRNQFIEVVSNFKERPDLIIYMSDSKKIEPDDIIRIFNKMEINTPCILITSSNQGLFEEKLLNSGIINQHLIKPVSLKEIRNAIQISLK